MKVKHPQLDVEFPSSKITTKKEVERLVLSVLCTVAEESGGKLTPGVWIGPFSQSSLVPVYMEASRSRTKESLEMLVGPMRNQYGEENDPRSGFPFSFQRS